MDKSPPPALFKPSPWGPTPLVKGRCRAATEGIGKGAPVRTLGRMRGQSEEQASLEELCRAGARPRRPIFQGFALRGEFLFHVEKETKDTRGRAQSAEAAAPPLPPCRPSPRTPITGGRVLARFCSTSGAQNLSGFYHFIPGHRALAFQKLKLVRFHIGAWLCRAGDGWC